MNRTICCFRFTRVFIKTNLNKKHKI
jgi:hypothetical protein